MLPSVLSGWVLTATILQQTETLKLLFVLYFRILKHPTPTPLLPAALQGISKFSHLVNIDFFRDLLQVLKGIMARDPDAQEEDARRTDHDMSGSQSAQYQLLCIVTAFELLSGQGAGTASSRSYGRSIIAVS